ncbi:MAG: hypothetical protein JWM93_47, partial [Frankiales bacterium]|nr:hypothetical protein [Frankiales bacterium]
MTPPPRDPIAPRPRVAPGRVTTKPRQPARRPAP